MHKFTNTLTPPQVYRFALGFCQPHLQFRAVGKVTGEVLLSVLFAAAARISSIHETCGRLAKAPCEETFTAALYPQLLDVGEIKRRVNAAFGDQMPRALRRRRKRPLTIAVDLTLIAYYGKHELDDPEIYRSQARRGTNSFFAYATAYLVLHGERFTLAVAPVTRSEALKQVLQE
jgi:putative transposase